MWFISIPFPIYIHQDEAVSIKNRQDLANIMSLVTIDAAGANLKKGSSQTTVCDNYHYEVCNNFYISPTKSSLSQLNIISIKGRHAQSHAVLGGDGL